MKALQTDSNNNFKFRRLGGMEEEETKFIAVFASNLPLDELKNALLPDFYDRIAQLIIELPPLRHTPEDREKDWETVWQQLKFDTLGFSVPREKELINWIKEQMLYGNYRDLQKIAIYYKSFLELPDEAKKLEKCYSAFEFASKQYNKYYSTKNTNADPILNYLFDDIVIQKGSNLNPVHKTLTNRYKNALLKYLEKEYTSQKSQKLLGFKSNKSTYNWQGPLDKEVPDF